MEALVATKLEGLLSAMQRAGCKIVHVSNEVASNSPLRRRYVRAHARLPVKRQIVGYHTTTVDAARSILSEGFRMRYSRGHAFGKGVYLGTSEEQAMMYCSSGCVTLVCIAATGRWHVNRSNKISGQFDTVPTHMHPREGFHSMHSPDKDIVVVSSTNRVLPVAWVEWTM